MPWLLLFAAVVAAFGLPQVRYGFGGFGEGAARLLRSLSIVSAWLILGIDGEWVAPVIVAPPSIGVAFKVLLLIAHAVVVASVVKGGFLRFAIRLAFVASGSALLLLPFNFLAVMMLPGNPPRALLLFYYYLLQALLVIVAFRARRLLNRDAAAPA